MVLKGKKIARIYVKQNSFIRRCQKQLALSNSKWDKKHIKGNLEIPFQQNSFHQQKKYIIPQFILGKEREKWRYAKIFFLLFLHTVNHYAQQSSEPKKSVHVASPLIDPLLMELELDEGANVKLRLSFLGEKVATTLKQVDHFGSEEDLARNNFCKLLKTCCIVNNTITNIFFLVVNFTRLEFGAVCIIVFPSGLV